MPSIDKDALAAIQPELLPGEKVLWAGRPSLHVIFHDRDKQLIPFSLLWGGVPPLGVVAGTVAVIRQWSSDPSGMAGRLVFFILVGMPLAVIGQYLIWGRFIHDARRKKHIYFAVTNKRVIAVHNYSKRQVASAAIDALPMVLKERRANGFGTLRFTPAPVVMEGYRYGKWPFIFGKDPNFEAERRFAAWDPLWIGEGPVLADIEDVDSVHQLLSLPQARKEADAEAQVAALLAERKKRGS